MSLATCRAVSFLAPTSTACDSRCCWVTSQVFASVNDTTEVQGGGGGGYHQPRVALVVLQAFAGGIAGRSKRN